MMMMMIMMMMSTRTSPPFVWRHSVCVLLFRDLCK
jgi:hypothetical protein